MVEIGDTIVSLDLFREKFLCDLSACKGACCIEGDAGAPLEMDEVAKLEEVLPVIWDELSPDARAVIDRQGVAYVDCEGDLVTSIVHGKDCVFTCHEDGCCLCLLEKAYRSGRSSFCKPISCALYPIREKRLSNGTVALNYHRWEVCRDAVKKGRELDLPVYRFLKEPLIRRFGEEWYHELEIMAEELTKRGFNTI